MQDFELIVVDDCSTDHTKELPILKDKRIKYIRTAKNSGHDGHPKNLGIKNATSDLVCFLDDDDQYRPDALKVLYNYATVSKADVVYADYLIGDEKKKKYGWSIDFDMNTLIQMNYISMSVACVRRDCLLKVGGFNENVPKFKDWNLWIRLAKYGYRFMHVAIPITEVLNHENTISNKVKVETTADGRYLPTFFNPVDCYIYADKTCLGEEKMPTVAVFTLTKNRLDYTKRTFEQMKRTAGYHYDHFVIDQGSTDGTQEWLKTNTFTTGMNILKDNVGIAKGWNMAIEMTKGYDIIVKIDNDVEFVSDKWLEQIVDLFRRNRKMVLSPYVEGLENSPGGTIRHRDSGEMPYIIINDIVLGLVPNLGGILFASPKELYDEFRFEEASFYTGGKDYQLSMYAKSIGYMLCYIEELRIKHMDTTVGQHAKYPEYFKLREQELTTKYDDKHSNNS
jgi:glycosyltransferase involved in cell wall biosynthesis